MTKIGDNSSKAYFDRLLNQEQAIKDAKEDKRALLAEMKSNGHDPKIFALAVKRAMEDPDKAETRKLNEAEAEALRESMGALGEWAAKKAA